MRSQLKIALPSACATLWLGPYLSVMHGSMSWVERLPILCQWDTPGGVYFDTKSLGKVWDLDPPYSLVWPS